MTPNERQALLDDLHARIEQLAASIGAPSALLPQRHRSLNGTWIDLTWHEGDDGDDPDGWYFSLMRDEDGVDWELSECLADNPDYLLYYLFDEVTAKLAKGSIDGAAEPDQRDRWFAIQEDLLGRLNDKWRMRTSWRHVQMLKI